MSLKVALNEIDINTINVDNQIMNDEYEFAEAPFSPKANDAINKVNYSEEMINKLSNENDVLSNKYNKLFQQNKNFKNELK